MSNFVAGIAGVVGYVVVGNAMAFVGAKIGEALSGENEGDKLVGASAGAFVGGLTGGVAGAVAGWKIAKSFMEE